jgi:murein DD-endopeptidase MepM/ murein hydrolase activator NlpD
MTIFSRHPVDNEIINYGFGAGGDKWGNVKHLGVDYKAPEGTPVYAPGSGTVVRATDLASPLGNPWEQIPGSSNNGNHVIISHDAPNQATHTLYAHLSAWTVKVGQHVNAGDLIGYVGNTGYSFGAHLHWECFIDYSEGQYPEGTFYGRVDPLDYFTSVTVVPVTSGGAGGGSAVGAAPKPQLLISGLPGLYLP